MHVGRCGVPMGNKWVVPYNTWLSAKYACHINAEVCSSISAVKYLYKYVYKGHGRAMVCIQPVGDGVTDGGSGSGVSGDADAMAQQQAQSAEVQVVRDELNEYVDGRYASASEATSGWLGLPCTRWYICT